MPDNTRDVATTFAGGGGGAALLATVRWEQIPHGEVWKIPIAFALMLLGYLMYRKAGTPPPTALP